MGEWITNIDDNVVDSVDVKTTKEEKDPEDNTSEEAEDNTSKTDIHDDDSEVPEDLLKGNE